MRLFSIIRSNIRLITFAKFVKLLKRSTVEADLNLPIIQPKDMLKLCSNFSKCQPIYACKCDMTFNNSVTVNANIIAWIARKKLLENVTYSKTLSTRRFSIKKSFENLA